jgi:hypothetical protein
MVASPISDPTRIRICPEAVMADDSDDGEGGGWGGILVFIGIFVVGNIILYLTTGWVIIPIKK